ncbi:hypothetical protein HYE39_00965 [Mycoplasmopsis bovis]|nr:hypothetical protein [Mycoplasmopsis bovis]QQH21049.1 hypothetical protein HYE39_00965 [Mycoplasmopsis bovis]
MNRQISLWELIKKTTENMTNLKTLIKISISQFINEDNLDKLAGYYKLSKDLLMLQANNLWEDFLNKEDIHNMNYEEK